MPAAASSTAPTSTWGIPGATRKVLRSLILELRAALEEDATRQLAALGITATGIAELPPTRTLSPDERRARDVATTVIKRAREAGDSHADAFEAFVRESAFTFLDRAVALRCLEERGLLLVDGQPETIFRTEPVWGTSSLIWRVRNERSGAAAREVARDAYLRACTAMTERIRVLFDPKAEHAVLFPLAPTFERVVGALNDPRIPVESYREDEVLGWVYQYWNAEEKGKVYAKLAKGKKIETPEELAAASCLYTERYIVDYLVQNTLGTTWAEMHPDTKLRETWPYYVTLPEGNPPVERVPKRVRDITLLDPACGSGHFLVRAFDIFRQLYEEEGLEEPDQIPALILEHNLHGIDIDRRAVQIAALALYLKGCEVAGPAFRPRKLNLAAADVVLPATPPQEFIERFEEPELAELAKSLWAGLQGTREFGSLLHPERTVNETFAKLKARDKGGLWDKDETTWATRRRQLMSGLRKAFNAEADNPDLGRHLFGSEAAKGLDLLQLLGRRYDVVVANPPYAGSGNLSAAMQAFLRSEYREGRQDLYGAFLMRAHAATAAHGSVGFVTQHGWMFLRSFAPFRNWVTRTSTIASIADLGTHAFAEIGGEVVAAVAFVTWASTPTPANLLAVKRVVDFPTPATKSAALRGTRVPTHVLAVSDIQRLPEQVFAYWLPHSMLRLLASAMTLKDVTDVRQGLATADNERFVRFVWEVESTAEARTWYPYVKGGRYQKWAGLENFVVNWAKEGSEIKRYIVSRYPYINGKFEWVAKNIEWYLLPGLTYTLMAGGNLGVRRMRGSIFDVASISVFPKVRNEEPVYAALLNSRVASYFIRAITQDVKVHAGYAERLPLPREVPTSLRPLESVAQALKTKVVARDPSERSFRDLQPTLRRGGRLRGAPNQEAALLHALEGWNERLVFGAYALDDGDVQAVLDETGTPAGWYPLIAGYDRLPDPPDGIEIPPGLSDFLATLEHRELAPAELSRVNSRLRDAYVAGPGAKLEPDTTIEPDSRATNADDENAAALGARIPIPTETFLEELSQKLELHPISVHWLLEELRTKDGVVSPPEAKREIEDYLSVTLLRMLGYRWPEQDAYEAEHGPLLDPDLVDADGIIPLVACSDEPVAEERIKVGLERSMGEAGAESFVREVRTYTGRELGDWLRRDFFKRHSQQFKSRPICWHLRSPDGHFGAFVLYHRLSRATLELLRTRYAGGRIARLRTEQARARERDQTNVARDLQLQIEDIELFRERIAAVEQGTSLADRIRCRWKDETESGRPGPYAPDIDDGVKVNIRPFQENGLLPVTVIKKW